MPREKKEDSFSYAPSLNLIYSSICFLVIYYIAGEK